MTRTILILMLPGLMGAMTGCDVNANASPPDVAATAEHSPVYVDTVLPIEEEIRRFKERVGRTVTAFDVSAPSRDALIERFVEAVEAADTATLVRLALDPAEFIDLYYPHTMYTAPPYQLSPEVVWTLMSGSGEKGLTRILQRYAGRPLGVRGHTCGKQTTEGPNRLHDECMMDITAAGRTEPLRLFGSIIERAGRFAFVSYANDL